jgi:hypothetical protein
LRALLAGALLALVLVGWPSVGLAAARRLALVVGNNVGSGSRPPLRFAERDAERLSQVLLEIGGVARGDLVLLKGASAHQVRGALGDLVARVRQLRGQGEPPAVVLFYYSGHSDGASLELGPERLAFAEIRRFLADAGAAVRVAILDSCRSGGLVSLKGGTLGPTFDVRLVETPTSRGEVIITSSAASELALESAEIQASFFSHHLISGLRGAADLSGDGVVTLSEAYAYASSRTVTATADTLVGPQHPVYDYRLTGHGDLVLTQLRRPSALLDVPAGFDRVLVTREGRAEVVVELVAGGARRVATQPGRYQVRGWRAGRMYAAVVDVATDAITRVNADAMLEVPGGAAGASGKGGPASRTWESLLGLGAQTAAADRSEGLLLARAGFIAGGGWSAAVVGSTGRATDYRESQLGVRAGHLRRFGGGLRLVAGAELGAAVGWQHVSDGRRLWTPLVAAAVVAGAEVRVGRTLGLHALLDVPVSLFRRRGEATIGVLPGLWLGISL